MLLALALLTGVPGDPLTKSPVELHRLPIPTPPPPVPLLTPMVPTTDADRFCMFGWRGEGDGAGDIEWLLIESEWREPFEWWIAFCARLLALAVPCEDEDMALRDGELVTRAGTRPKRFSSTLEFNLVMVFRENRKLLLDMTELLCDEPLFSMVDFPLS